MVDDLLHDRIEHIGHHLDVHKHVSHTMSHHDVVRHTLGEQGHLERLYLDHEEEHFHEIVDEDWLRLLNSCFHLTREES